MKKSGYQTDPILRVIYTCAVFSGLLTFFLFFYPTFSDSWNRYAASRRISQYLYQKGEEKDYTEVWAAAEKYNQELFSKGKNHISEYTEALYGDMKDKQNISEDNLYWDSYYESLLTDLNDQMMGYIEIPSLNISLPIYHYTTEEVLGKGIGHLYGSSLPVGGNNTHSVLTGHSGLLSARLFTDLEKLEKGDVFQLHVLDRFLNYEVDQKKVVLPDQLDDLAIREGKDEVTLLTCTPYGINTHRLLVRGHRIADGLQQEMDAPAVSILQSVEFPFGTCSILLMTIFLAVLLIMRIWRKENR